MINEILSASLEPPISLTAFVFSFVYPSILAYVFFKCYLLTHGKQGLQDKLLYQEMFKALILSSSGAAVITIIVGDNLARAFVLVGILHLTRFRTNPKRSLDMMYIFVATVIGILSGSLYYVPAAMFTIFASVAVSIMNLFYHPALKSGAVMPNNKEEESA